jgi:hypothetical protein
MKRVLFTIFAAGCLLAALATITLAIRSYWIDELLGWETRDFPTASSLDRRIYSLQLSAGGLRLSYTHEELPSLSTTSYDALRFLYTTRTEYFHEHDRVLYPQAMTFTAILPNYWGFSYHAPRYDTLGIAGGPDRFLGWHTLIFPAWILVPVLLLPPARWLFLFFGPWRRQRRARANGCPICAYDLRMHTPGQKCPECGTLVTLKK